MMSHTPLPRIRRVGFAVAAALLAVGASLALAGPAAAHDELLSSDPADGSVVETLPEELALTFSGELLDDGGATEVVVTDASGADLTDGDPVVTGAIVRQALSGTDVTGTVTVLWKVVSSDGHPISEELTFAVGEASDPSATPVDPPSAGVDLTPFFVIGGIIGVGALGALVAVLVARARRSPEA